MKDITEKIDGIVNESNWQKEDINEAIFNMSGTFDAGKLGKKKVTLPVVAPDKDAAEKKFKDMVLSHVKNGHLPKGNLFNIKVDSQMGK